MEEERNLKLGNTRTIPYVGRAVEIVPGVVLALAIYLVAHKLEGFIGETILGFEKSPLSTVMVAIILGLVIRNTVGVHKVFSPGVSFCLKRLLRLGIVLLGIRLSVFDMLRVGGAGVPVVTLCITTGIVLTIWLARWLNLPERLGTLIAVGTGICGASAIVATAPGIRATDEEVAYAVANITVFGIIAMFVYPLVANVIFSGVPALCGLFLGTSIHETAQVAGAGLMFDEQFLSGGVGLTVAEIAIITKLTRNLFMALVIPLVTLYHTRRQAEEDRGKGKTREFLQFFPLFILGFILMGVVRSIGDATIMGEGGLAFGIWVGPAWKAVHTGIKHWSGIFLAVAMAGVGLGTGFWQLRQLGIRPFYVGLLSATSVGITSMICIMLLGGFIRF